MLGTKEIEGQQVIWVKPLDEELEPIPAELLINMDEKPLMPDSASSRTVGIARAQSRGSSWTVTPCINARGDLIMTTLILRGESVSEDIVWDIHDSNLEMGATFEYHIKFY